MCGELRGRVHTRQKGHKLLAVYLAQDMGQVAGSPLGTIGY